MSLNYELSYFKKYSPLVVMTVLSLNRNKKVIFNNIGDFSKNCQSQNLQGKCIKDVVAWPLVPKILILIPKLLLIKIFWHFFWFKS